MWSATLFGADDNFVYRDIMQHVFHLLAFTTQSLGCVGISHNLIYKYPVQVRVLATCHILFVIKSVLIPFGGGQLFGDSPQLYVAITQ